MRTTLAIEDRLLSQAKRRARQQGLTLGEFVEEALRRALARPQLATERPTVPVFRGEGGLRPGVDATSNRSLLETLDEDRPIEQLR